jgi:hypothetical protein
VSQEHFDKYGINTFKGVSPTLLPVSIFTLCGVNNESDPTLFKVLTFLLFFVPASILLAAMLAARCS